MSHTQIVAPVSSKKYYTYELSYPEGYISEAGENLGGRVFYVGKGTGDRIHQHEAESKYSDSTINIYNFNHVKCQAIRTIHAQHKQVVKTIVYETDVELDAYLYEWVLINLIYQGRGLTNRNPSGRTYIQPKKEKVVKPPRRKQEKVVKPPKPKREKVFFPPCVPILLEEMNAEEYCTAEEAIESLSVSRATLERLAQRRTLQKYRRTGDQRVYFKKRELDEAKTFHPRGEEE